MNAGDGRGAPSALPRPVVWHVGRSGEVAGGMTQVVNGYVRWPFEHVDVRVVSSRDGSKGVRGMALFLSAIRAVMRIRDRSRNIFVVHLSQGGSFLREGILLRLAHARGFGTIAHLHGSSFVAFAQRKPRLVGRVLSAADKIIALSEATRDEVCRHVDPGTVVLVPNAVPSGTPRPKERRIVFGGSVSYRKGVDVLSKAWESVDHRGWILDIAGPIADPEVLPEGLTDVVVHGPLDHARLMVLLETSAIAVLPSRDEAMPMFILEALGRDNCVIATTVGGIPSVLGDGAGLLVAPGDAAALADAFDAVLMSPDTLASTARRGRQRFDQEFSAEAVYPLVEKTWLGVLPESEP